MSPKRQIDNPSHCKPHLSGLSSSAAAAEVRVRGSWLPGSEETPLPVTLERGWGGRKEARTEVRAQTTFL